MLEQYRRLGMPEAEMLANYPGLRAADLVNAWAYVDAHPAEIEDQIRSARLRIEHDVGIPDRDVLDFAHAERRAVLTHNRKDFRHLHEAGHAHSGIVICTADRDLVALSVRIGEALGREGELAGKLIRVVRPAT